MELKANMNNEKTENNIIDVDEVDNSLLDEVKSYMGDKIYLCLQCGNCTSGCPMNIFGFNIRKIVKMVILGLKNELIESDYIWYCSECGKCGEKCPHDLKNYTLISILHNIAIKEGNIPPSFKAMIKKVQNMGNITDINEAINLKRERCGLPELDEKGNQKTIDEINIILNETKIADILKQSKKTESDDQK